MGSRRQVKERTGGAGSGLSADPDSVKIGRHWFVQQPAGERLRTIVYARVMAALANQRSQCRATIKRISSRLSRGNSHRDSRVDDAACPWGAVTRSLNGYRIGLHHAAARVIGRRGLGFAERKPKAALPLERAG